MSREASVFLSRFLDDLGYSHGMVKLRQGSNVPVKLLNDTVTPCGSKAEGLTLPLENDTDQMLDFMEIECHDACNLSYRNNEHITFQIERLNTTPPGYALLKCISLDHPLLSDCVRESLVEVDRVFLLSSDSWKLNMKDIARLSCPLLGYDVFMTMCRDNQGPSCPSVYCNGLVSADNVFAIRCHCSQYIDTWKNRRRLYEWPSSELIETVSALEAHVVPIGYKDSPLHFLEWRICFTQAEICLIKSLNDCQTKLIIVLKMLAKHALKPVCKEMTSYVMKNLVLWMAETNPTEKFVEHKLLTLLKHSLKVLKRCILKRKLPSYMIEERNLFADRISHKQRRNVCIRIDILLREDTTMLLRCPKIRDGLNTFRLAPDQFYLRSERRRSLESVLIDFNRAINEHHIQLMTINPLLTADQFYGSLLSQDFIWPFSIRCALVIMPDILDALSRGENVLTVVFERFVQYLS